jgi:hypothetical protein
LLDKKYYESTSYWIQPGKPFTVLGAVSIQLSCFRRGFLVILASVIKQNAFTSRLFDS